MSDERLRKHFNFDEADLHANRSGRLTEKQQAALAQERKSGQRVGRILGLTQ